MEAVKLPVKNLVGGALRIINPQSSPEGYVAFLHDFSEASETTSMTHYQNWVWPGWQALIMGHTHQTREKDQFAIKDWLTGLNQFPPEIRAVILEKINEFDWKRITAVYPRFKLPPNIQPFNPTSNINILPTEIFKDKETYLLIEEFDNNFKPENMKFNLSPNVSIYFWNWDKTRNLPQAKRNALLKQFQKLPDSLQESILKDTALHKDRHLFSEQAMTL